MISAFSPKAIGLPSTCQGSDAILKCEVQMVSPAVWWKNGQMIENSTKHTVSFNATTTYLVVHDVSVVGDNGAQYRCSDNDNKISNPVVFNVTGKDYMCVIYQDQYIYQTCT